MLQHRICPGSRKNSPHLASLCEGNFTSPADSTIAPGQLIVVLLFAGGTKQLHSNLNPSVFKVRMFQSYEYLQWQKRLSQKLNLILK